MEYLINVLMAGSGLMLFGLMFYLASVWGMRLFPVNADEPDQDAETSRRLAAFSKYIGITLMVVGLVVGMTSPANTYKNQTFDVQESHQKIERINTEKRANAPAEIQNLTPPRISSEERKAAFDAMVDYKKQ